MTDDNRYWICQFSYFAHDTSMHKNNWRGFWIRKFSKLFFGSVRILRSPESLIWYDFHRYLDCQNLESFVVLYPNLSKYIIIYFVSRDKIWEILCQRRADRVIVTHGTDTIIQTGNFLDGDTKVFLNQKNVNLIQYTIFQKKSGSQKGMIY